MGDVPSFSSQSLSLTPKPLTLVSEQRSDIRQVAEGYQLLNEKSDRPLPSRFFFAKSNDMHDRRDKRDP